MEVMGLMLGEFVDDYTVRVIDVFAMPQSGTVSINYLYYISLCLSNYLFHFFSETATRFGPKLCICF